jgi:hypothetical protein
MLLPAIKVLSVPVSLIYLLTIWGITGFAYRVNARRSAGDPQKRDFHPAAILIAPITLPVFTAAYMSLIILKAILYGIFLVILTFLLVIYRKPTSPTWLEKLITKIGSALLDPNTALIRLFIRPLIGEPQQI